MKTFKITVKYFKNNEKRKEIHPFKYKVSLIK
jgi:hypothetical protein